MPLQTLPRITTRRLQGEFRCKGSASMQKIRAGPTLNNFGSLCSSGALRAFSEKCICRFTAAKIFLRLHRMKRQNLSEIAQPCPAHDGNIASTARAVGSAMKGCYPLRRKRDFRRRFSPHVCRSPVVAPVLFWLMPRHGCASCSDKAAFVRTNVSPPRSCRFFIAPFSHDLDSSPQSGRATRPLSSSQLSRPRHSSPFFLPRSFSPAAPSAVARSFRPRSLDATTQRSIRSPVSSFSRHGLRMPPFSPGSSCPLIPVKSRLPNIPPDDAELPQASCAFPPLPCALTPRPPSDCIPSPLPPGIRSDCNRHAFVPLHLHTQKARQADADGPLHLQ